MPYVNFRGKWPPETLNIKMVRRSHIDTAKLDSTVWGKLIESSGDTDELMNMVSSCISYHEDIVIPVKTVMIYLSNKPFFFSREIFLSSYLYRRRSKKKLRKKNHD